MGSASDSEEEVDAKTILAIRTSAKRRHTRKANHLKALIDGEGKADDVNQADKKQEQDAIEWEAEINTFYTGCRKAAEEYSNKEKEKMDAAPNAKKRRLELDFEREQAKLEEQSKLEDIRQQSQQIEYQRQLEDARPQVFIWQPRPQQRRKKKRWRKAQDPEVGGKIMIRV
ncbi:hypothetical protein DAPPUDRAFT_107453 [Daphnia pulex]|uniref:Uncharacterized protein n=1 Tax=Daphnia pulex TaxID=6669 RepID=E9GX47_DAPPU|nr:hypothetical protein DAPPUDRAFT_107453 [Daphnia pulex]|eukprot:EFX75811.1 hypothetical protein DAPPUDRAFT_107453 [Daphnia pulex]